MRYDAREQRQHQRWLERQRKKERDEKKSLPQKEERGTNPMGNKDVSFSSMYGAPLAPSVSITIQRDEIAEQEQAKKRAQEQAKERAQKAQEALDRLTALPGMDHLKAQIEQIIALKKVEEKRKAAGLKTEPHSLHMIFAGNPGTGKTTAARLIGEAFVHLGLLKSSYSIPPFVEVHLNDVESKFIGEAEQNMKRKFLGARGGVLFMDEAYSFGGPYQHNRTFLANLVSLIEDMRDEVLVIAAGYTQEMHEFLDENPGLRSRFPTIIDFPDYEAGPLLEIADMMAADRDYSITGAYRTQLLKRLEQEKKLQSFGNARTIRNIIEQSIRLHSVRMMGIENPTKDQLMSLTAADIDIEVKIPKPKVNKSGSISGHIIMVSEKESKRPFD